MNLRLSHSFRLIASWHCIPLLAGLVGISGAAAQVPTFEPGKGPTVLVDMGHYSLLNGERNLSPAQRLMDDGFVVETLTEPITEAALAGVDIVAIVGAINEKNSLRQFERPEACAGPGDNSDECMAGWDALVALVWRRPIPPAFSEEEVDTLETWVRRGGGLFLVSDIFPFPAAIENLVSRFGIEFSNGFAVDETLLPELPQPAPPLLGQAAYFSFRRDDGSLADHAVTNGRSATERVDIVGSATGSAFRLPPEGESLFTFGPAFVSLLPDVAWEFSEDTPRQPIGGWSQGGLLRVDQGRIAIFAESGILNDAPGFLEAYPGSRNSQLALNAFHWLAGVLDDPP